MEVLPRINEIGGGIKVADLDFRAFWILVVGASLVHILGNILSRYPRRFVLLVGLHLRSFKIEKTVLAFVNSVLRSF